MKIHETFSVTCFSTTTNSEVYVCKYLWELLGSIIRSICMLGLRFCSFFGCYPARTIFVSAPKCRDTVLDA